MRNKISFIAIVLICANLLCLIPKDVYAYSKKTTIYKDGDYYVDNTKRASTPNQVIMYVLVPKDAVLTGYFTYTFKCTSNNFNNSESYNDFGYDLLKYEVRFDNFEPIAEIGTGQLVCFKFSLENGTYVFSTNDYNDNKVVLTQKLENPLKYQIDYTSQDTINKTIYEEKVNLNNNAINLYCLYGSDDFVNTNSSYLANYVKTNNAIQVTPNDTKNDINEMLDVITDSDKLSTSEKEALAGALVEGNDTTTMNVGGSIIDVNEQATSSDNVTITNSTNLESQDKNNEEKEPFKVDIGIIIYGVLFCIVIIIVIAVKEKRR